MLTALTYLPYSTRTCLETQTTSPRQIQ
uniref:Uncharacterized protein n=1 Tax=Anguilla anguilla TaxID=7936 RepID=A0A0E9VHH6_ANGAN